MSIILIIELFIADDDNSDNSVCFSGVCVSVEVADSPDERAYGLMGRTFLCADCGMIFVYGSIGRHDFWMKDTLIPLDMVWMDGSGRVVYVERDVQPCVPDGSASFLCPSYGPDEGSLYVLEVNAGMAEQLGVDVGDFAEINPG